MNSNEKTDYIVFFVLNGGKQKQDVYSEVLLAVGQWKLCMHAILLKTLALGLKWSQSTLTTIMC